MRIVCSALVLLAATMTSRADDGAASIAAGGIVVMTRETRIVMAKEVLTISPSHVLVDYDFRNDSDGDVTTEVAFPIPGYTLGDGMVGTRQQGFDDFKLWVGGVPVKYTIETRALVGKRDITGDLRALHIDAASFGHFGEEKREPQTEHLNPAQRKRLIALRAIDFKFGNRPLWRIEKKYHWAQTFPAHGIVHIKHEYTPVLGNSNTIGDPSIYRGKDATPEYAGSCPTPILRTTLSKVWADGKSEVSPLWISYVSFILTTANTWKTPIEDFTLIVERPHDPKRKTYVSFCWDGPVTQVDADHFSAHVAGLVPTHELMIGYIHAESR